MTKFSDALAAAVAKSAALQTQIDGLIADKAVADKLVAEAGQISSDSIALFDQLAAELAAAQE